MKLVEFSVTNYRSITTAHKIMLHNLTVLVGKNNEGKSNLLRALNVAMSAVAAHSDFRDNGRLISRRIQYKWESDFPVQYQNRHRGLESIFRLNFRLEDSELSDFHSQTGIGGNENIPIVVKIGKDNIPKIEVPKRGSAAYKKKSREVTQFVSNRIYINYIQAVRTDDMAIRALQETIWSELKPLYNDPEYKQAIEKMEQLQQNALDSISNRLLEPLKVFLPNLQNVAIKQHFENSVLSYSSHGFDVIVDDGTATSISNKGDGIKNLITLAILKNRKNLGGVSVIAIEEPESHLHSGAIHSLVDVIHRMSENSQVIITTHNPLFVQQNRISSNIIVDSGTARCAKSISEIRNILGVLPSDNLLHAQNVLLVEGESDKISLLKLLPKYSEKIAQALQQNQIVIKPLCGAGNLSHDAADLKNCMCRFVVLLDNDNAGQAAGQKAISDGVVKENEIKFTICNGSPEAEFEDCLNPEIYATQIRSEFGIDITVSEFHSNEKWSNRLRQVFLSQGSRWTENIEKGIKLLVANCIPESTDIEDINKVVISQKAGFMRGIVNLVEDMLAGME